MLVHLLQNNPPTRKSLHREHQIPPHHKSFLSFLFYPSFEAARFTSKHLRNNQSNEHPKNCEYNETQPNRKWNQNGKENQPPRNGSEGTNFTQLQNSKNNGCQEKKWRHRNGNSFRSGHEFSSFVKRQGHQQNARTDQNHQHHDMQMVLSS